MARQVSDVGSREASGATTRFVLAYVERTGGRAAVDAVLARSGFAGSEAELRDEDRWFPFATKVALFEAAGAVLGDERIAERAGRAVLELDFGAGLKRVLRALGTPRLVYRTIVRTSAKVNRTHRMTVERLDDTAAVIRYEDVTGTGYDPHDCAHNVGLLACPPALFGLPQARVEHPTCALHGGDACVYNVRWSEARSRTALIGPSVAGGAAVAAGLGLAGTPLAEPVAGGLALAAAALGLRAARTGQERLAALTRRAEKHDGAADQLAAALRDLGADLRPDEVLTKLAGNARTAVAGKEFAIILAEGGMRCVRSSPGVPRFAQATLEVWAEEALPDLHRPALIIDDVSAVPALAPLARDCGAPLGSACAAPLRFRGMLLGVLVALGHGREAFRPDDAEVLSLYAAQAAIALSNATLVERLRRLADEDPLTGLANHRRLNASLDAELSRADCDGGPLSLVIFDLDRFGRINQVHGHAEGDRVLRRVAMALSQRLRTSDVVARLTGQQFAVVLPGVEPAEALRLADRVRADLGEIAIEGLTLTCSAGVATFPRDGRAPERLLQTAFDALSEAKAAGRDRVRRADPSTAQARAQRRGLVARVRACLTDPDAVQMLFQPIADLSTRTVTGFEALARFPTLGLRPDVAIAQAHEFGLGPELEAKAIAAALAAPGRPRGTSLTLNVSLSALGSHNLWAVLPADLRGITIEITEHELYESDEHLGANLARLRARGARIAVDDTGSGYAGLQQLTRVRPDMVKLDRALVAGVAGDGVQAALIEAFVGFARATGATVCAEGIEELCDLRALAALGVSHGQGFCLARPAPAWSSLAPEAVAALAAADAGARAAA